MNSSTGTAIPPQLEQGFKYLKAGQLDQADSIARQLLTTHSNDHGAFNLLGLVARQQGLLGDAIAALQQATVLKPDEPVYHCNLGAMYHQHSQYSEAIAACKTALDLRPDYPQALITLGSSYFSTGRYREAAQSYRNAIQLAPNQAIYHAYLADALREIGKFRAAINEYEVAIALAPDLTYAISNLGITQLMTGRPELALEYCYHAAQTIPSSNNWMNLGTVYRRLERLEDAMDAYGKAHELAPQSAMICTLIGQLWQEVHDLQQAMLWFDKALELESDSPDARCSLADVVLERGDTQTAINLYQDIQKNHPEYCPAYLGLSDAFWEDGNAEEAVATARQAVDLKPEDSAVKVHLARILASAGDVDAANTINREALSIHPNCIPAFVNLALNLRGKLPEEDAKRMEQLLASDRTRRGYKIALHFGLAHYYDGCKRYAEASVQCTQGNSQYVQHQQSRGWDYAADKDAEKYAQLIDQMMTHFNPEFFERTKGMGNESIAPVFVVGMPRSGTTLTEQILASHPYVFGAGERPFAARGFYSLPRLMKQPTASVWDVFDGIGSVHIQHIAHWHLSCLNELILKSGGTAEQYQYIIDKMPSNYHLLGWLVTLFPNAKIIHCRRDVRDVAVSCWMTQFKLMHWAFDLEYIAERIRQYQRIMDYWRQTLPVPILEIDYEETVGNQTQQTQRLLDFVGIGWNDACLEFYKTERLVKTASVTQVRQPIYKRSLNRWQHYEDALQPLLRRLGYL
jgi:tetratricopeptide (TPR) repeat protein